MALESLTPLVTDISRLIEQTRLHVARTANAALVLLYWQVGARINQEVLRQERAEYGEMVLADLSKELISRYGKGFDKVNLHRMVRFARMYPDKPIVVTLSQQLTWSHIIKLVSIEGEEQPLGIIICTDKDQEDIELMELGKNGIHVAQYLTELPPKHILEKKLRRAIENAREKYERIKQLDHHDLTIEERSMG